VSDAARERLVLVPIGADPEVGKPMTNAEFHRVRTLESYDVAPDWAVHHILQHEAEHRSHIAWLRDSFPRP